MQSTPVHIRTCGYDEGEAFLIQCRVKICIYLFDSNDDNPIANVKLHHTRACINHCPPTCVIAKEEQTRDTWCQNFYICIPSPPLATLEATVRSSTKTLIITMNACYYTELCCAMIMNENVVFYQTKSIMFDTV